MARYVIQFLSAAHAGQDAPFNEWYDNVHKPDVLAVPGFLACRRHRIVESGSDRPRYMAAYDVECDDPNALLANLLETASKSMVVSPALDPSSVQITIFQAM